MPPFGVTSSAWWFFGKLRPTAASRFNVQEVEITQQARLEVLHDLIAVWSRPGPSTIAEPDEVRELFAITTGAYALISGVALDWSLDGWVEATAASFEGTVVGSFVDRRGHDPDLSADSPQSVDMRRAAELTAAVLPRFGYSLALRDIHAALSERGDDALVFAYRAIEDVARAVSLALGDIGQKAWACLHEHLETTEEEFRRGAYGVDELFNARTVPAHGSEFPAGDRPDVAGLVSRARRVVAETLAREASLPFELGFLRP